MQTSLSLFWTLLCTSFAWQPLVCVLEEITNPIFSPHATYDCVDAVSSPAIHLASVLSAASCTARSGDLQYNFFKIYFLMHPSKSLQAEGSLLLGCSSLGSCFPPFMSFSALLWNSCSCSKSFLNEGTRAAPAVQRRSLTWLFSFLLVS